jgi:predicted AAA+ superfamily ATPase
MAEIPRNNTGLSGEYFVAAELYRRGWSVGMTIGNAKAVDLFAEKENTIVQVQVKSIYKRGNIGWPIMKEQIKKDCIYIFVNLNADKMTAPDYFICTSEEAYENAKQYSTRGIVNLNPIDSPNFKNRWDKLQLKSYAAEKLT